MEKKNNNIIVSEQQIVERLPMGVVVLDSKGKITYANARADALLGCELSDKNWVDIVNHAFAPQQDDGHEISLNDGRRVSLTTISLAPQSGQLITLYDVTLTRAFQSEIASRMRLIEMGKMSAKLAHQIRTPLASMLLYLSNLESEQLSEEKRDKCIKKMRNSIRDLEKQVSDMLLYARGGSAVIADITIQTLFDDIKNKLGALLSESNVDFQVSDETNNIQFRGNLESLSGSIQNLIQNSIQACAENKVKINLRSQMRESFLEISVEDNGQGISESDLENITKPFFTTKSSGTGLGLSVVQAVVKAHYGEMKIESKLNNGTIIKLIIPVAQKGD